MISPTGSKLFPKRLKPVLEKMLSVVKMINRMNEKEARAFIVK